jgi:hypothetical protein
MSADRDERVDAAIAEYLAACDAGAPPAPAAFLARHPDLADSLREFLADHARMRAAPPRDPARTAALSSAGDPDPPGPLGTVRYFGDYELLAEIARGGMGVVFRARQVSLNREVALKMILSGQLASTGDLQRFRVEAEAAANLDHPNVLPIHEVGEHAGQPYFSMRLVAGGSLADRLASDARPPVRDLVRLLATVCRAVHFAHQRGVLHRDLKPANVLLDPDGTPFVTDFGLAKRTGREDSGLTRTGAVVGTPSYMAPEQARGEKGVSTAADVYALGAILYEVIAGRPPFRGPTVMDTLLQVMTAEPADPRSVDPAADRDLALVALKCLEKDPGKRYASAADLADELGRWLAGEPLSVRPLSPAAQAWRWLRRNAGGVAGSAGVGIAAGLAVGLTYGLEETRALFGPTLAPHVPGWANWLLDIPAPVLAAATPVVLLAVCGLGWAVVSLTRPADRVTAVTAGLLAGLAAGSAAFVVLGPVGVIRTQQEFQITRGLGDRTGRGGDAARPADGPAPTPPVRTTPEQFVGAYAGVWMGLIRFVLPFAAFGALTAWAADHLRRTRGNRWRVLVPYLELAFAAMCVSLLIGLEGTDRINRFVTPQGSGGTEWLLDVLVAASLLGLASLIAVAVLRRWRWWSRLLAYFGWYVAVTALGVVVLLVFAG